MNKTSIIISMLSVLFSAFCLSGCKEDKNIPLNTVSHVDINKYLGKWYEISKYPFKYEKDLVGITAEYSLRKDGSVKVLNSGYLYNFDGKLKTATGKAYVADKTTGAKLRVSFFGPFFADYWIIGLGENYEYAVVSEPSRKYLWILSRTPKMNDEQYNKIVKNLAEQGFDTSKLIITPHK